MQLEELPEPVGSFIIKNCGDSLMLADGAYYHYSQVCVLLKKYVEEKLKDMIKQRDTALDERDNARIWVKSLQKERNKAIDHLKSLKNLISKDDEWSALNLCHYLNNELQEFFNSIK